MSRKLFIPPTPEELDASLPSYLVITMLSKDKRSACFYGMDEARNLPVVIKVFPKSLGADPSFLDAFNSQLEAIKQLSHDNLISVYEFGLVDEMPFVVTEYMEGNPLERSTKGETIEPEQAVRIILGLAQGLAHAHERGILHTDINPDKIFLNQDAKPFLTDFGYYEKVRVSKVQPDYGSSGYAARETLSGQIDQRADIYSLGVVFYELLTGGVPKLPYQAPSEQVSCGTHFDHFLVKALHPEAAQRHRSITEFVTELSEIFNQSLVVSQPQVQPAISLMQATSSKTESAVYSEKPLLIGLISAAVAAILVWMALIYVCNRSTQEDLTSIVSHQSSARFDSEEKE